jgi:hypothetical protein
VIKRRRMGWAGLGWASSKYGWNEKCIRPTGKRPLGRPSRKWENNIWTDLQEVGWGAWAELIWLKTGTPGELL